MKYLKCISFFCLSVAALKNIRRDRMQAQTKDKRNGEKEKKATHSNEENWNGERVKAE